MRGRIGRIGLLATVCAVAMTAPAAGKTFTVTSLGDSSPGACNDDCTLREAVLAANDRSGDDVIVLPSKGRYELGIANTNPGGEDDGLEGDLDLAGGGDLTIRHTGRGRATIDANDLDRVFDVLAGSKVTLSKLTVTGGQTTDWGGGVQSQGKLTIIASSVRGNESDSDGGGIGFSGVTGSLVVRNSTVSDNHSHDDGGGISFGFESAGSLTITKSAINGNEADDWAGGVISASPVAMTRSTIAGNTGDGSAGGIAIEGPDRPSTITGSTISGNRAGEKGGGIVADGTPGRVNIVNSTVANNASEIQGGGVYGESAAFKINATTIARNESDIGGGVFTSFARVTIGNSIIALNTAEATGPDCTQEGDQGIDTAGRNVFSKAAGCPAVADADVVSGNPRIGALGANGGPTKTIPLRAGSPAIGFAKRATAPGTDQRGHKRDKRPDAGAFEL